MAKRVQNLFSLVLILYLLFYQFLMSCVGQRHGFLCIPNEMNLRCNSKNIRAYADIQNWCLFWIGQFCPNKGPR